MAHPANIRQKAIQRLKGDRRMLDRETTAKIAQDALIESRNVFGINSEAVPEEYRNIPIEQCMVAYPATNYADFSLIKINRPVDPKRVNDIASSIRQGKNLLKYFPIIVNRNLEIIDGQHRHAAAWQTEEILYVFFGEDIGMEDSIIAVANTKNWTISNWLHTFAERGFIDYMILRKFYEENDHIPISTLIAMCSTTNFRGKEFSNGHYRANRIEPARKAIEMAKSFEPYAKFTTTRAFLSTLMNLSSNPEYDHRQMMTKMKYRSSLFRQCVTVEEYLDMFSDIYNYRSNPKNRVFFKEQYRRQKYG